MEDLDKRIRELEVWKHQIDIQRAAEAVDRKHIDNRFDDIEESLDDIKETTKWLTRTIWGAILLYLINFILQGGLSTTGV